MLITALISGCKITQPAVQNPVPVLPSGYNDRTDTVNVADIKWREYFKDPALQTLIDTALLNNQDLMLALQDIEIARNHVLYSKGKLLPSVNAGAGAGIEKVGLYTSQGAGDASAEILPGEKVPEHLPDYFLGLTASWEVDVWGKLRNAKRAAYAHYLESVDGRNFVITNLISEIADNYYELVALDNQLQIIRSNIQLQTNAVELVKIQKQAATVTELAVKQFEAQLLQSQTMEFEILQQITEHENQINLLCGRARQPVIRNANYFNEDVSEIFNPGVPSQLLSRRPDILAAEQAMIAAKCNVSAAKAEFYPSLDITGLLGFQAFKTSYLFTTPESFAFNLFGELTAPLINRSAIKAEFNTASAEQLKAMYEYQRTILNAYTEVSNEMTRLNNLKEQYKLKSAEVETLNTSIDISGDLFKSARATYVEVLLTQRDALSSKLEQVEMKKKQWMAMTDLYRELGGGWK